MKKKQTIENIVKEEVCKQVNENSNFISRSGLVDYKRKAKYAIQKFEEAIKVLEEIIWDSEFNRSDVPLDDTDLAKMLYWVPGMAFDEETAKKVINNIRNNIKSKMR